MEGEDEKMLPEESARSKEWRGRGREEREVRDFGWEYKVKGKEETKTKNPPFVTK